MFLLTPEESGFMTNAFRDFFVATLGCVCVGLLLCPAFVWAEAIPAPPIQPPTRHEEGMKPGKMGA
jgi:hypothetical protein